MIVGGRFLPAATGQVMVHVVVGGGGDFFAHPLDDLLANSCSNNLGRSSNSKNPDLKQFLRVTNPFRENHPKRFKL